MELDFKRQKKQEVVRLILQTDGFYTLIHKILELRESKIEVLELFDLPPGGGCRHLFVL